MAGFRAVQYLARSARAPRKQGHAAGPSHRKPCIAIIQRMRKFIALIVLLMASLFVAQSAIAAAAAYSDCCADGCQGPAHCVSLSCKICAAAPAMLSPTVELVLSMASLAVASADEALPPAPPACLWTPPD